VVKKIVNSAEAVVAASKLKHGKFYDLNMKPANAISSVLCALFIFLNEFDSGAVSRVLRFSYQRHSRAL